MPRLAARASVRLSVGALLALAGPLSAQQLGPAGTGGLGALDRALQRLTQNKRVLVIAAHPDDEDTELLTLLGRGLGVDAAYLSLSRGEGGQNLIGPELGELLGLIRTGELLAARSVDGGRQYFTRAFDFGFSKSLAETERFWPRDSLLADAVRIARRFRPQIIVSVFSGTPRDGHGQHQMAGVIARQLFEMLRDSAWGPAKLYRATRFDTAGTTVRLPTSALDPIEGRSYFQLAMASRSLHRSQDMGQLQRIGPSQARLGLLATRTGGRGGAAGAAPGDGLFAGVDTALAAGLVRYAALIDSARALLGPRRTARVVPLLTRALAELRRHGPADFRAANEPTLEEAIATAADVIVDASADDGRVVGGQRLNVAVTVWNAGGGPVTVRAAVLDAPYEWLVEALGTDVAADGTGPAFFSVGRVPQHRFVVTPVSDAPLSEPYFLMRPRRGGGEALYDWSAAPDSLKGEPFQPPPLRALVTLDVAGVEVRVTREVSWRYNDQGSGEVRRPVVIVPAVGVAVAPQVLVWPIEGEAARTVTVELTHGVRGAATSGELRLDGPPGWPAVPPQRFTLEGEETRRAYTFELRAPRGLGPGSYEIAAVAWVDGRRHDRAAAVVDYPHIRPVPWATTATVRVTAARLALPPLTAQRIGYVRGASDLVPEALAAVGAGVQVLTALELERGDLAAYDVIVIGSRAYETEPALVANNGRLLDWARAGGRLIVQYQQYAFVRGSFAPFPLRIAQPHDRVTDEDATVTILEPGHPVFLSPNRIGETDWAGWVQERGLYFAREWDPAYRPLLETGDNGERLRGGLLVARLGRGLYVYTGLSFFRQLPAGVPGALRLFLNLLSLEAAGVP